MVENNSCHVEKEKTLRSDRFSGGAKDPPRESGLTFQLNLSGLPLWWVRFRSDPSQGQTLVAHQLLTFGPAVEAVLHFYIYKWPRCASSCLSATWLCARLRPGAQLVGLTSTSLHLPNLKNLSNWSFSPIDIELLPQSPLSSVIEPAQA